MADQGKWFKLWCSALEDPDLENLELDDWACWARLGAYIKKHGTDGELVINEPARALNPIFRVSSYSEILKVLWRLPNLLISNSHVSWPHGRYRPPHTEGVIFRGSWYTDGRGSEGAKVAVDTPLTPAVDTPHEEAVEKRYMKRCLFVSFLNWSKYQDDLSTERVRKKRANETPQEENRSRREVEENKSPYPAELGTDPNPAEPGAFASPTSTPRENGTNLRALGLNRRALGTNPRANGTNPRALARKELDSSRKYQEQEPEGDLMTAEDIAKLRASIPKKAEAEDYA